MDQIQNTLLATAHQVERQLDNQLERLDNLDSDDLRKIREQRLQEMKDMTKKRQEWLANVSLKLNYRMFDKNCKSIFVC